MDLSNERAFALLKEIGERRESAMREIYRAYSRKIYAYVLNHLRDPGEAEEIVVDTMHEVWKNPDRFRGQSKLSTWLIGIARYKMLTALRERGAEHDHDDLDDHDEIPADGPGTFELLAEQQRREGVRRCMDKLSDEHREALHLVFYEGMSVNEVALVQHCPENTVKTRLFHARQKIKNCLRLLLESEEGK
jgi:RNA polymerase sigma-70 factor (ECF subfamily)